MSVRKRVEALGYDPAQEPHEPVHTCAVCLGTKFRPVILTDRYGFQSSLSECECGLRFLNPRMTAAAYDEFYKHWYRKLVNALNGQAVNLDALEANQLAYATRIADWIDDVMGSQAMDDVHSLLDIGGSTGVVAAYVKGRFGIAKAIVLDPSFEELARARNKGLEVRLGSIEGRIQSQFEPSDLVLMCQTIDHLLDPRAALATVRRVMTPKGWFFVDILKFNTSVPLTSFIKVDHPYYFTVSTARHLLQDTGFTIVADTGAHHRAKHQFLCQKR